jgi:SAM-dependent methyltransferase
MKPDPLAFKASWLALREPHDHAARDDALTRQLCRYLRSRSAVGAPGAPPDPSPLAACAPIRVLDLGCGTGSSLRYLAPRIEGNQHWKMVDRDPALLALLPATFGSAVTIEPVCLDLAGDLRGLPLDDIDLITASALLDLVSADWVERLLDAASATTAAGSRRSSAAQRPALLLALSYDGSVDWQPALPDDRLAEALFNRHQRGDKGFGPALGPDAAAEAARRLEGRGFSVTLAPSPWRLGAADSAIQRELLAGIAGAAAACAGSEAEAARVRSWWAARDALLAEGRSTVEVGHQDLLAQPSPE